MRDATTVIEKQRRTIGALTEKVAHLEALVDQSPHIAKAIARDPELLMKTVDLLLAESDTARKDVAAHPVCDDTTEQVKAASAGRVPRDTAATSCRYSPPTARRSRRLWART